MKYGTIYKITNLINGKEYVGQTTGSVLDRFNDHCVEKRNRHISNAIIKYGKSNFKVEQIASAFSKESLNDLEVHFVQQFNTMFPNGYNHRAGGNQRGICSEQTKLNISKAKRGKEIQALKNRIISNEQRYQISKTLGGKRIIGISVLQDEVLVFETAHSTREYGHNPSNVVQICKKKGRRRISKGFYFFYFDEFINQVVGLR